MHTRPALEPTAADRSRTAPGRRVTDAPTRMFHWLFVLSFVGAYVTADGERWRALHNTLGYTMAGLLAFRVLYGLIGPRHAGVGRMFRKLAAAPAWLASLAQARSHATTRAVNWRQGQNLAMATAIVALIGLVVPVTLSGYGANGDGAGWLGGDWVEGAHAFFGEAMLAVVLGHLALILGLSLAQRRNQALPMLTGRHDGTGPDLVKHNRGWLAALLLVAVLGFVGWEWQQSPSGLIPPDALRDVSSLRLTLFDAWSHRERDHE